MNWPKALFTGGPAWLFLIYWLASQVEDKEKILISFAVMASFIFIGWKLRLDWDQDEKAVVDQKANKGKPSAIPPSLVDPPPHQSWLPEELLDASGYVELARQVRKLRKDNKNYFQRLCLAAASKKGRD